ncbi:MAG: cation transporter [Rhodospirillales bacterium]|nr:MAG: cation transporter [Rhodospirillales bacterium]
MTAHLPDRFPAGLTQHRRRWAAAVIGRSALFVAVWWVLARDLVSAWWVAPIAVGAALLVSLMTAPPAAPPLSITGLIRFVPFFAWQSIRGGIDVVLRALHPRLPIAPGFIDYTTRLPPGRAVAWFALTISLLPGSLTARVEGQRLVVHVLDARQPVLRMLAGVEERVQRVFAGPAASATEEDRP